METMKHIQREETRYANNEFENMPSVDYCLATSPDLCKRNQNRIDFNKVSEICKKYGFNYTLINSTFGGDGVYFMVYLKTNEDVALFDKRFKDLTDNEKRLRWNLNKSYNDTYRKLHDCIHELDEQTDLLFRCSWCGNCGLFGSNDVKRQTYSFADGLDSWRNITNHWSPLIHDITSKLSKGVYIYGTSSQLKPQPEDSPLMEDFEPIILEKVKELLSKKYKYSFEYGKRGCDTNTPSYKALVIRYADNDEYCGMIRFNRDNIGRYFIKTAAPLCGETSWKMDWENPTEDLARALDYVK